LAPSGRKWSSGEGACSGQIRETAEEADFFVSGIVLDIKMCSETHSDIPLVVGHGIRRGCGCDGVFLLGEIHPSSDTCPGRDSARWGGEFSCCILDCRLDWPMTPELEAEGQGWGGVTLSTLARLDPSTPRLREWCCWARHSGSIIPWPHRGGGGWGGTRVVCRICPLTMSVG
jgi:hypothetical protein